MNASVVEVIMISIDLYHIYDDRTSSLSIADIGLGLRLPAVRPEIVRELAL